MKQFPNLAITLCHSGNYEVSVNPSAVRKGGGKRNEQKRENKREKKK